MSFKCRNNTGFIFKKKKFFLNSKYLDYKGTVNIGGTEFTAAAWKKLAKNGVKEYQADLGSYRNCLEDELKQVSPDLEAFADIEAMISEQLTGDTNEEYSNNIFQNLKRK